MPVKDFWSVIRYSNQTRSMIQTNQRFPSVSSQTKGLFRSTRTDGRVFFGPKAPAGKESQLGPDRPRNRLEHHPAALRSAEALVRQDLEAGRDRDPALTGSVFDAIHHPN